MVLKQGRLDSRQSPQPPGQGAPGAPRGPGREGPCPCSVCRSPTQHASSHRQLLLEGEPQTEDRMGGRGTGARRGVQRRGQLSQAVRPATVTRNQSPRWRHRPRRRVQGNLGDAKISADTRLASREKPRAWGSARRPQLGSQPPTTLRKSLLPLGAMGPTERRWREPGLCANCELPEGRSRRSTHLPWRRIGSGRPVGPSSVPTRVPGLRFNCQELLSGKGLQRHQVLTPWTRA